MRRPRQWRCSVAVLHRAKRRPPARAASSSPFTSSSAFALVLNVAPLRRGVLHKSCTRPCACARVRAHARAQACADHASSRTCARTAHARTRAGMRVLAQHAGACALAHASIAQARAGAPARARTRAQEGVQRVQACRRVVGSRRRALVQRAHAHVCVHTRALARAL
eukprot:11285225-Alexandrium_andersonii.AAC.1